MIISPEHVLALHHQRETELFARADEARRARAAYAANAVTDVRVERESAHSLRSLVHRGAVLLTAGRAPRAADHAEPDACAC